MANSNMSINLSEISIGTETNNTNINNTKLQKGGWIWSSNFVNNNKKALLAAQNKNFAALSFMIDQNMINNFGEVNSEDGSTILHYLASSNINNKSGGGDVNANGIAQLILNNKNVKNFIDIQDNLGNTPMHLAVKSGNHVLASLLDKCGCDKDRKNHDGFKIASESEFVNNKSGGSRENISSRLINKNNNTSSPVDIDINLTQTNNNNTDSFVNNLVSKYSEQSNSNINTDILFNKINKSGGAKKSKTKKIKSQSNRGRELNRLLNRQADDIHRNVLDTIISLLKLDKANKKDEDTAKDYKAALWRKVRDDHPELKSNLDLTVKLKEMTTKEVLDKLDPKKGAKYREESRKRMEERIKESSEKGDKSDKMTEATPGSSSEEKAEKKEKKEAKKEKVKKEPKKKTAAKKK